MQKRFLRIAPGYAVATIVATAVVGLVAPVDAHAFWAQLPHWYTLRTVLFIYRPAHLSAFPGNHYEVINASLWTILYEFRCYCIVALWGLAGLFKRSKLWLGATATLVALFTVSLLNPDLRSHVPWPTPFYGYFGRPQDLLKFTAVFFIGGCFSLYKKEIALTVPFAIVSAGAMLLATMLEPAYVELAVLLFGSYLIFYCGSKQFRSLSWMTTVPDLYYGIYLYGWPVESFLIWRFHPSPWIVFAASTFICAGFAWLSWTFVERPAMALRRRLVSIEATAQPAEALT